MRILLLVVAMLLSACAMPQADPARIAQATQVYEWVRDGDVDSLTAQSTPTLRPQLTAEALEELHVYTAAGRPKASKVVSWRSNVVVGGASTYEVVQQLDYPQTHVLVAVVMERQGEGAWQVNALQLNTVSPGQMAAAGGFSLQNKSPLHYAVLAGIVIAPLFCLVTAGVAGWRRRWGWMVFSLFGVAQLALNWNTGAWEFQPLNFALLGAGAMKGLGPLDPWILTVSLPVPALLFWILKRYRSKAAAKPAASTPIPADETA